MCRSLPRLLVFRPRPGASHRFTSSRPDLLRNPRLELRYRPEQALLATSLHLQLDRSTVRRLSQVARPRRQLLAPLHFQADRHQSPSSRRLADLLPTRSLPM
jgi:hypothetical protein